MSPDNTETEPDAPAPTKACIFMNADSRKLKFSQTTRQINCFETQKLAGSMSMTIVRPLMKGTRGKSNHQGSRCIRVALSR